jgi:hypothetical protein
MAVSSTMPPIPLKEPMTDKSGFLTQSWARWIQLIFVRTGGAGAVPTNADIIVEIANINTSLSNLSNQLISSVNDLDQGRQL